MDRLAWNFDAAEDAQGPKDLSVSSYGSIGLEPSPSGNQNRSRATFSILLRIDWPGTFAGAMEFCIALTLSVSSYGSIGLEPLFANVDAKVQHNLSVSSYGSIGLEPVVQVVLSFPVSGLSVSSYGSIGLEPSARRSHLYTAQNFQYPLTDRLAWNPGDGQSLDGCDHAFSILLRIDWPGTERAPPGSPASVQLSVSSYGSIGLEPYTCSQPSQEISSFSILLRIDWPGTA